MVITLRRSEYQPISLIDLHQLKRIYLKPYSSFLRNAGSFIKKQFKQTAFYQFWLIASADV